MSGQGLLGRRYGTCYACGGPYRWTTGRYEHRPACPRLAPLEERRQVREATLRNLYAPVVIGCALHGWDGDPEECRGCYPVGSEDV